MEILHKTTGETLYEDDLEWWESTIVHAVQQGADLTGADLRRVSRLEGSDLRGAKLAGADLEGADLRGVDLRGVDLRGVDLLDADLRQADLEGSDLRGTCLVGANLTGADLRGADLTGAAMEDTIWGSIGVGGYWEADLRGARMCRHDLSRITARLTPRQRRSLRLSSAKKETKNETIA